MARTPANDAAPMRKMLKLLRKDVAGGCPIKGESPTKSCAAGPLTRVRTAHRSLGPWHCTSATPQRLSTAYLGHCRASPGTRVFLGLDTGFSTLVGFNMVKVYQDWTSYHCQYLGLTIPHLAERRMHMNTYSPPSRGYSPRRDTERTASTCHTAAD